jgi:hypothetical protein
MSDASKHYLQLVTRSGAMMLFVEEKVISFDAPLSGLAHSASCPGIARAAACFQITIEWHWASISEPQFTAKPSLKAMVGLKG